MEKMEKKINLNISDGDAFFAHEVSVNFSPLQFILDFKSITPRTDPRSNQGPVLSMKHNVIMVDPYHLQEIVALINDTIKRYEEQFGKIKKPKQIEMLEKKNKNLVSKQKETSSQIPTYLG